MNNIIVSESHSEVELQSLLNHTRILQLQDEYINDINVDHLIFFWKWGFDGSTSRAEYKQTMMDSDLTDSTMFFTSYMPLRLEESTAIIYPTWQTNPVPILKRRRLSFALTKRWTSKTKLIRLIVAWLQYEIEQLKSNILCNLPWLMVMFVMH